MIEQGNRYLVTTNAYFYGPDGDQYRAAWGKCFIEKIEQVLGFTPIRPSTNWFLRVGEGAGSVIIAGCQIHYLMECPERPKSKFIGQTYIDKDTGREYSQDAIYLAELAP